MGITKNHLQVWHRRDKLKAENAIFQPYENGNYGYFEIANNEMQLPELHGYWFAEPVIFRFEGELEVLRNIVAEFAARHGEEVNVSLNSYRGEEIHSYSL